MALAVALSERGASIDRREIGAGAKAAEDEMRAATRRSFIVDELMDAVGVKMDGRIWEFGEEHLLLLAARLLMFEWNAFLDTQYY